MQPRAAWLVLGLLVTACGKVSPKDLEQDQTSSSGVAGSSSSSGGTGSMTPVDPPLELECTEETRGPGPSPLSRLSNFELNRSLRALNLQSAFDSGLRALPDDYGFDSESPGPSEFEYHELVHDLALRFSQNEQAIRDVSQCDPASSGEASCQAQFLERFLERAYRRAVTEQDIAEMTPVFADGRKLGGDFASGARAVVEVALQSPEFLYLLELGSGEASGDAVALTGFESASRLSYFLTGAPPDDALLEVAAKGPMSVGDLEAEARRLLGTAPNRELVRHFYTQLLGLVNLREDAAQGYGPEIASLALEATGRFVEDVTFDGAGTFRALMTEPSAWVNEPLAPFYGVEGVKGDAFQKVKLDPQQRSGLFTQVAFLANSSRATEPSPIQRAMVVLRRALCYEPPPPPPSIPASPLDPVGGTLRGRLTALTQDAECQGCHQDLNPVGFAFQNYDPVGKWRDAEPQGPINASGYLRITSASGNFANAVELLQRIAESYDGDQCFASQWLTRAYRRRAEPGDGCAHEQVVQAFRDNDGKLVELLVALAKTDNFRFRLKSELLP